MPLCFPTRISRVIPPLIIITLYRIRDIRCIFIDTPLFCRYCRGILYFSGLIVTFAETDIIPAVSLDAASPCVILLFSSLALA
jgi:hypothetical protein